MLDDMVANANNLSDDAEKIDKGNKAACTRLRVGLIKTIKECKEIRGVVLTKVKKG